MIKTMHHVKVSTTNNDEIEIEQEWNDMNHDDPIITISSDQAGMVALWLIEAASESGNERIKSESIPIKYWSDHEDNRESLQVYNNDSGMIILNISDDSYIEISPSMAKRMRDQLSTAISISYTDMLKGDEEV